MWTLCNRLRRRRRRRRIHQLIVAILMMTWPVAVVLMVAQPVEGAIPPAQLNDLSDDGVVMCRSSKSSGDHYLPVELFGLDACAGCYRYLPDGPNIFRRKWNTTVLTVPAGSPSSIRRTSGKDDGLSHRSFNVTFLISYDGDDDAVLIVPANATDEDSPIRTSFRDGQAVQKWTSCCMAALDCCQRQTVAAGWAVESNSSSDGLALHCPPTWDGWTCWNRTAADQHALAQCPHYIYFETEPPVCPRYAVKSCTPDGSWSKRRTDYVSCGPVQELKKRTQVHIVAYAVSAAALLPALVVFYAYKQLSVYRIRLHKNMFFSILLNSIFVVAFKTVAILPPLDPSSPYRDYINQNSLGCRLLLMMTKYFRLTNYMWMFCEGFYLHRLIAAAFAEQKSFLIFYIIGWVFPLAPTVIYAAFRAFLFDEKCWVEPIESYEWILNAPCLICLLANMFFLVNIIRILVMKLRTAHSREPSQYRKAVRATLVLVPLFGLHFVITIYRPVDNGCQWIEVYHYVNALLDGLQGALVAIIFCYANGEIHYLVKRSYKRFKEDRRSSRRRSSDRGVLGRTAIGVAVSGGGEGGGGGDGAGDGGDDRRIDGGGRRHHHRGSLLGYSTTHYSMADIAPHNHLISGKPAAIPPVLPEVSSGPNQEPLIRETCLDDDMMNP